jgi:hypothetical protein
MRAAPPVVFPIAGAGPWIRAGAVLAGCAVAVPFAWLGWHLQAARLGSGFELVCLMLLGLLATGLAAAVAWRRCRRCRGEQLRWDGGRWQLLDAKGHAWTLTAPTVQVDLGEWLLLRACHTLDGASAWLPVQRDDAPPAWHALRVAVSQPHGPTAAVTGVVV